VNGTTAIGVLLIQLMNGLLHSFEVLAVWTPSICGISSLNARNTVLQLLTSQASMTPHSVFLTAVISMLAESGCKSIDQRLHWITTSIQKQSHLDSLSIDSFLMFSISRLPAVCRLPLTDSPVLNERCLLACYD
jgi:hypothetical protein